MKKLNTGLLFLILCILVLIFCQMKVTSIPPLVTDSDKDFFGFYLTMQANQFALLQVYLSAFGIILTGMGIVLAAAAIWGYKELKAIALEIATSKITETVPLLVKTEIAKLVPEQQARASFEVTMETPPINNSNDVFTECVTAMYRDPMELPSESYVEDK